MSETVTQNECRAIRQLDRGDYTRSEIAFMFEIQVPTVTQHADRECHHQRLSEERSVDKYSKADLRTAFRVVYDTQPYKQMSQQVYQKHRPEDYPSYATIAEAFGGWINARKEVWGNE